MSDQAPGDAAQAADAQADQILRAVHRDTGIRVVAALTSGVCRTAATRHGTSPAVGCALGRGLTAALLLATLSKANERVTLQFECDGPLRTLNIDAYDDGDVRGYPGVIDVPLALPAGRRQRISPLLRRGVLSVIRDIGVRDRYQGQTSLTYGEVDEDVEHYLRHSEQVPSALGAEVVQGEDGAVLRAAGVLFQVMPGGDEAQVDAVQAALRGGALYDLLRRSDTAIDPAALCAALAPSLTIEALDRRPVRFQCRCSRGRIDAMLRSLPARELDEMITEGGTQVTCNYCNETYRITVEDLAQLRQELGDGASN